MRSWVRSRLFRRRPGAVRRRRAVHCPACRAGREGGLQLAGEGGLLQSLIKRLVETAQECKIRQTISTITDKVVEGMAEWQNRPLDPVYPVIFIDAIHVRIRDR